VVVPAGTSRTVEFLVDSDTRDEYTFNVDVLSDGGALIDSKTFSANVVEGKGTGSTGVQANTTVLLTVILAIIFVVLLVVLIVLLTRKPESKEEYGESYY
jgi:preprotein translocase subunit SecG